jgi:class 3 adenylate cyclase
VLHLTYRAEDTMPFPKIPDLSELFGRLPRFGDLLRDYRTLRGVSVEELAEAVGIAPSAIRDMEAGKRAAPPKDIVIALADALHLSKSDREQLIDAADLASPTMHALMGKAPAQQARPTLQAAILVFLIADIRGYTRFTQEYGDEAAARLTERFAEFARGAAERWGGQLVEVRGDEVLLVFASARQAVRAAQELTARYGEEAQAHPELPPGIGVGLDLGEAVPVEDGYRGTALNRAARLCSLAGPGEVLVSTGVVYVAPQVDGVTFLPRGQEQIKGFDAPIPILLAAASAEPQAPEPGGKTEPGDDGWT